MIDSTRRRRAVWVSPRKQLTERDREIVRWVGQAQLATRKQIQKLFFTEGGKSLCQDRLTFLTDDRYLDRVPDRAVNAPEVYCISRRCTNGLRLLRALEPDHPVKPHLVRAGRIQHTLSVADCKSAFLRACTVVGYSLVAWLTEDDIVRRIPQTKLMPDGYCQIARTTPTGSKRAGFFVEVERSGKTTAALAEKFRRYGALYYQGQYEQVFQTKGLRILVLVGEDYGLNPAQQIRRLSTIAEHEQVTIFRFAALSDFLAQTSEELLIARIWQQPGATELCSLFEG